MYLIIGGVDDQIIEIIDKKFFHHAVSACG